ncbi:MAG: DUF4434 domain-containing protein, partial [Planctomycetota bacterium]|nr:DUF4434 domain-containing protein [Planctomycetota bacterium]
MKVFYFSVFFVTLLCGCTTPSVAPMEPLRFSLFSRPFFVQKNERVTFDFLFKEGIQGAEDCSYRAVLMRPHQPYEKLLPHGVDTHFCFRVGEQERDGFYVATGYILEKRNEKPLLRGIAKRSFLCGRIIADFLHIPSLPDKATKEYLNGYLKQFKSLGGNLLIADSLVTSERAFYPSNVCRSRVVPEHDFLLEVLEGCDREGIAVLLSLPWDVSADLPHSTRLASLEKIMYELYLNYGAHPSFCGYYSHLTGGSLDYALYIRTFTKLVKSLDDGLLTACSPYLEDPLLAGYLASIEWLDIILPQTRFSASRLPSDGRFLPVRRAADYIKCFAGASSRKKLLLPRIELFSPSQETALSESDVKGQILAVSSVGNLNGIALYSYHRDVYPLLAAKGEKMEKALQDALTAFNVIQSEFSSHPTIAIYYPSSGRLRSANSLFDSLDSLRRKGISSGVVVFVPPSRESLSPFPPTMADEEMVRSLAESARVILLCDVVALSESDCSFINEALSSGATLVVSGFPLPTGTCLLYTS